MFRTFLRTALAGAVLALAAPAQAALVKVAGPGDAAITGSTVNNFGFGGVNGVGVTTNANAMYWDNHTGVETYNAHNSNFAPVAILFVFSANGAVSTYTDAAAGTYDAVEDTQIGVLNMSGHSLGSIQLTGASGYAGFDGDGISDGVGTNFSIASTAHGADAPGNANDPSLYGGPSTWFTTTGGATIGHSGSSASTVNANFLGGLADGTSTYFSLEGLPGDLANLGVTTGVPEPATVTMLGMGVVSLLGYRARRQKLAA
jgi:hypothetical protein